MDLKKIVHAPQYGVRRPRNQAPVNQPDLLCCGGEGACPVTDEHIGRFHYPRDLDLPVEQVQERIVPSRSPVKVEIRKSRKIPTRIPSSA